VNYYEHHLGDWAAATAHLTWDEDTAYSRLLRAYYHTEQPIPAGQQYRLARASTPAQRKAVDAVLAEFFTLADGAYRQKRADAEIARFQDKQRKAKASANARWADTERTATGMRTHSDRNANALRAQCDGNALQTPDSRLQSPDTKHQTTDTHTYSRSACEFAQFTAIKAAYPAGTYGQHHWQSAERSIQRLVEDGQATPDELLSAVSNFTKQQTAMGRIGTQFITSPNKFFDSGMWQGPFPLPKAAQKVQPEKPDLTGWIPPEYRDQEQNDVQT
jgi:uncharacterized protein YdaU (DUF1376 family)